MKPKLTYELSEISCWHEKHFVELPKVQRGFVWRPSQIEDLWDSLLRGYPIGAFVFNANDRNELQLLDGQQRATAITLGFANETFRGAEQHIKLFIDLELPPIDDTRRYYFRVVTDSHPWGYQRKSNVKPLEAQQKREAMRHFDGFRMIEPELSRCFPYDASLPVPFDIFLTASQNNIPVEEVIGSVYNWSLWKCVRKKFSDWHDKHINRIKSESDISRLQTDDFIKERITSIYRDVNRMLKEQQVPALYLKNMLDVQSSTEKYKESEESSVSPDIDSNEDQEDEVENLFVRLNAGGTPLRGEELNYSILKAKMPKQVQSQIEESCREFIPPARFITIAFRLYQHHKNIAHRDGLSMNIKPKQFQGSIGKGDELNHFQEFLLAIINNKIHNGQSLISYTRSILDYHPQLNEHGLPHLITNKIAGLAPEILFTLWYRISIKEDEFEIGGENHRKALGILTLFYWLGKGDNRDFSKLMRNIWPAAQTLNQELFWSAATVKRATLNKVLFAIPNFDKSRDRHNLQWFAKQQRITGKTRLFDKYYKATNFGFNAETLFFNRDLVLYAQRDFLYNVFNKKQYHLDDTNMPFDWDHISPNKLLSGKKNMPQLLKDFYNSIGNFRAWPYELNRMDSDDLPAVKFNPLRKRQDDEELRRSWSNFICQNPTLISTVDEIPQKLLQWSFCDKNWAFCENEDLRKNGTETIKMIIDRALKIMGVWYKGLLIEALIPNEKSPKSTIVEGAFNSKKVIINPKGLNKEHFDFDYTNLIIKRPLYVGNSKIYLYLCYDKNSDELIKENDILFGLYENESSTFISTIKIPEQLMNNFELDVKQQYIQGYFTLVSEHKDAMQTLLNDINKWIADKQSPIKGLRNQVKELLTDALKTEYRKK